jgi:hypothetical protein
MPMFAKQPPMRPYRVTYTDGVISRRTGLDAPDIAFACMKARKVCDGIIAMEPFGKHDWLAWRFEVVSDEEGSRQEPFLA